jgi:type IV pilus assembly protein PilE
VRSKKSGFTLLELMIALAVVAILLMVAYPSYQTYIIRTSREAAESQLQQLANLQEKIFLNSSAYASSVTTAYNGTSSGGLGLTSGTTIDGKYTITLPTATASTFTLQAAPVTGTTQAGDGNITITHTGQRLWNGVSW